MINEIFNHTYLINLRKRPDRLAHAQNECKRVGIDFEVFPAIDADEQAVQWHPDPIRNKDEFYGWNKYAAALLQTTINILEDAKRQKYSSILILEDDIVFHQSQLSRIEKKWFDQPWDFFYLGAQHLMPKLPYEGKLKRISMAVCCHAYAINDTVYDQYLEKLYLRNMPIDWVVAKYFHGDFLCLCLDEDAASQGNGFSNIKQRDVQYKRFKG